jgi:hypothetical protein
VRSLPQGFLIYVEARRGLSGRAVGTSTFNWDPDDPNVLPHFQIVTERTLGNGSTKVCDNQSSDLGGVPASPPPPMFFGSQAIADRINDYSCRFDTHTRTEDACTVQPVSRDPRFTDPFSTTQFCSSPGVGAEIAFPSGKTRLTARVIDTGGFPGEPASIIIDVQP